ncbi:MAG: hypothetical protein OEN51_04365 [Gammaproteobacteria bacterium]|nr:hypothetical protein [Gammaproteobacteria bacterium]
MFFLGQRERALVYGEYVSEQQFLAQEQPAVQFAEFVEKRVIDELTRRLDIDTSDESVQAFMRRETPDLVSIEKTHSDQKGVKTTADALQAVLDGEMTPEEAYTAYELEAVIELESWKVMANNDANQVVIDTMHQFANAAIPEIQQMSTESMRPIFLNRTIREAICRLPDQEIQIRERIARQLNNAGGPPREVERASDAYECAMQANNYILDELKENVQTRNPELLDYVRNIRLLDHVLMQRAAD